MIRILLFLILLSIIASCRPSKEIATKPSGSNTVSVTDRDGSSYEKAIIITEKNESSGVAAEYAWLRKNYPGYRSKGQTLNYNNKKPFDLITIITSDGVEKTIYFDISNFYGRF
jgi:hypothetical protein